MTDIDALRRETEMLEAIYGDRLDGTRAKLLLRHILALQAALDALQWQPMEACPRDGTRVFAVDWHGEYFPASWNAHERLWEIPHGAVADGGMRAWMPMLPEPPK